MGVFVGCSVLLELRSLGFRQQQQLKAAVSRHGGSFCYVVTSQCSLVVSCDAGGLPPHRRRALQRHRTPLVRPEYLLDCVAAGRRLPVDAYRLDPAPPTAPPGPPGGAPPRQEESRGPWRDPAPEGSEVLVQPEEGPVLDPEEGPVLEAVRIYTDTDPDLPEFPLDFQVAKYCFYEQGGSWVLLELQSAGCGRGRCYRVVCWGSKTRLVLASTSEEALDAFRDLGRALEASGLRRRSGAPPEAPGLGSTPLQQLLLEERVAVGSLSPEVSVLVELLWAEALGRLGSVLRVPFSRLSLNDVGRAEGLLLQARRKLLQEELQEAQSLLEEVYVLLPHREAPPPTATLQLLSQKLDLCQLVRDVLGVSESAPGGPAPSSLGRYRALRCSMEALPPQSNQFQAVARLLQPRVRVLRVVRVCRGVELQTFRGELGNVRPLLHASSPSNLVGILSRGLLPPHRGLELHGVQRTDQGDLGSGIYFGDSVRTCLRFSRPGSDGSRFLLVCDVALGRCMDLRQRDPTLTRPPPGHHSVRGVARGRGGASDFQDDEFVVYSADQVQIRYLVQFLADGDQLKESSPETTVQTPPSQELQPENEALEEGGNPLEEEEGALGGGSPLEGGGDPLGGVAAGLLDGSGRRLPLQAVQVKVRILDLFCRVVLFQTYSNPSPAHIEAKYVFPLEEGAAVCGFEAFINGKHLVGQVKEKEAARREYRQAVARGDGAYLLDQDAPDVFSLSVGNLPPGASVLIKLAFLSELVVSGGAVRFFLPGRVAPWQQDAGLNQTTQVSVQKMCVSAEEAETREFRLEASVEMPQEILSLDCSHRVQIKRTACRAVVRLFPGQVLEAGGFHLSVFLPEAQQPRMWVEQHPERESQACMLVFYPDLDPGPGSGPGEVVLLLDCSESMRAWLEPARTLALRLLRRLDPALRANVLLFGSDHCQAFLRAQPLATSRQDAERFIRRAPAGGSTELWRPLRALGLLPPALGLRNLLLLSDGHVQNAAATLTLLRGHAHHTRLFTCGLSPTANRHMLRALAQAGGGAYEFFDTKTKHNWPEKVRWQVRRMAAPGCSSVSVSWQQFGSSAPEPIQAPKQLTLFSHQHTLVYGLIPRCTQATLRGQFCGQELSCTVSTTDLQTTTGTFLHRLTARALIRDYEDGNLETTEAEHEGRKAELKAFIIRLSREFSLLSQFTSFVAVEERDSEESGFTDVPQLIAQEDVDFLPYMGWTPETHPPEASSQDDDFSQILDYNPDEDDLRSSEGSRSPERIFCDVLQEASSQDDDVSQVLDYNPDEEDLRSSEGRRSPERIFCDVLQEASSQDDDFSQVLDYNPDEDDPGILQGLTLVRGNSRSGSSVGDDEDSDEDSDEWDEELETCWSASVRADRSAPPAPPPSSAPPPAPLKSAPPAPPPPAPLGFGGSSAPPPAFCLGQISAPPAPPPVGLPQGSSLPPPPPPVGFLRQVLALPPPSAPPPAPLGFEGSSAPPPAFYLRQASAPPPPPPVGLHRASGPPPPPPPPVGLLWASAPPPPPPAPRSSVALEMVPERFHVERSRSILQMQKHKHISAHLPAPPLLRREKRLSWRSPDLLELPVLGAPPPMEKRAARRGGGGGGGGGSAVVMATAPPPGPASKTSSRDQNQEAPHLETAHLDEAHPDESSLDEADLDEAHLDEAHLDEADLDESSLDEAHLDEAHLDEAHLDESSLDEAHLDEAYLDEAYLDEAHLDEEHLDGTHLGEAHLDEAHLETAHLDESSLDEAHLDEADPDESSLDEAHLDESTLDEAHLDEAHLDEAYLDEADLDEAHLDEAYLDEAHLETAHLETAHLDESSLDEAHLDESSLDEAHLDEAHLDEAHLDESSLEHLDEAHLEQKWDQIFQLQHSDGFWELSGELGALMNLDLELFADVFLKSRGICSLGVKAHLEVLRMVATLLVLQMMRMEQTEEGRLLTSLFRLDPDPQLRCVRWARVKRAVDWAVAADRRQPSVCSRLEFGLSWDSSTQQLLGYRALPPSSPLRELPLFKPRPHPQAPPPARATPI